MAAKPTGTYIIPAGYDLMITPSNGTRPSTDNWGHIKVSRAIGRSKRGGKVKKTNLVHKCVLKWPPNPPKHPLFLPDMT